MFRKRASEDDLFTQAEERLRARMDSATESTLVTNFVHDLERQASQNAGSKN